MKTLRVFLLLLPSCAAEVEECVPCKDDEMPPGRRCCETANAIPMFDETGELTPSPLAFDGVSRLVTDTELDVAGGSCRLMRHSYASSSFGILRFPTGIPDKALFSVATGGVEGNRGTPNPIMAVGYNGTPRGGKWRDNENSLAWYIEADWNDGTNRTMETYVQYDSADDTTTIRPLFFMFNRETDRLANAVIRGNPLNIQDDRGTPAMEIGPVVTNMYATYTYLLSQDANVIGARNVYLSAGTTGGVGTLYLGGGSVSPVNICANGCDTTVGGTLVVNGAIQAGGSGGPKWITGVGSPEGNVACPVGCLYTRRDGGPGTTLCVKESGDGVTGWSCK